MLLPSEEIKKIIVFRALQLGDWLCAVPAIRALRHAYPDAEITLCGLLWSTLLVERFPVYFDRFIHFPGYPGLPEQAFDPRTFPGFLEEVQGRQFDLALQLQGNGSVVNAMVELFGARYTAGYYFQGHYYPDNGLFMEYPNGGSEIERHLKLMNHLGIPSQGNHLEFPITEKDQQEFAELDLDIQAGNYVCIHPGSRGSWRQWPTEYFAALADYSYESGYIPVITGTKDELAITAAVVKQMKHSPVLAAGKTSLGAAALLIKNARALVSNCTGVSHMAAAFETQSIVISMDGEPERWAPVNRNVHYVIDWLKTPDFELAEAQLVKLLKNAA